MRVTVHYLAQIKRAAGCATETVESSAATLHDFLRTLADRHDANFRALLLDDSGIPRKSLLFFVADDHVDLTKTLADGDEITILAPMSGG